MINENGRSLAGVVTELKEELKEFLQTRYDMLRRELKDKIAAIKVALPLMIIGLVLLGTAWFLLTAALVVVIALAFGTPYAYFYSFLIVGVAYLLVGVICAVFAVREIREQGVTPVRTIKVLKEDSVWLQTEAKSQI